MNEGNYNYNYTEARLQSEHYCFPFSSFFLSFFFFTVSHFQRYWKVLEGQPAVPEVGALHFRHGEVDCPSPWASLALPGI